MTMLKSLLLGSAAGLVAVAGAQAADLPAKAKAVEYVKVCDAYGAGFYYIPGTDTCLKVGGAIRVDYYVNSHSAYSPSYGGQGSLLGYTNYSSGNMSFQPHGRHHVDPRALHRRHGRSQPHRIRHAALVRPLLYHERLDGHGRQLRLL